MFLPFIFPHGKYYPGFDDLNTLYVKHKKLYNLQQENIKMSIDQLFVNPHTNKLWATGVFPFFAELDNVYTCRP